ncbi:hypothetical protein [Actinomadura sp. 3N508]|uniref:hypothetical protein n=1 Tax=Actinomadura sp. 3N508 TaxID=3375153 RepID=UPI003791F174
MTGPNGLQILQKAAEVVFDAAVKSTRLQVATDYRPVKPATQAGCAQSDAADG